MKYTLQTVTLLSISALQLAFTVPTFATGKSKKEETKKAEVVSKELTKTATATTVANSQKNMSMEIAGDTAYYNGKAILVVYPYTSAKNTKLYTIQNLKGERIAFVEVGPYINGQTCYNINFLASHQAAYGSMYESFGEMVEVMATYVTDGQLTAANVIKITTENKLKLAANVAFKYPVLKNIVQPKQTSQPVMAGGSMDIQ